MRFRGFSSVKEWLETFKSLHDYWWRVTMQRYQRSKHSNISGLDEIFYEQLPYGDHVSSLETINPSKLTVVTVTGRTPSASSGSHIFDDDFNTYFGERSTSCVLNELEAHGFVPYGEIVKIC